MYLWDIVWIFHIPLKLQNSSSLNWMAVVTATEVDGGDNLYYKYVLYTHAAGERIFGRN